MNRSVRALLAIVPVAAGAIAPGASDAAPALRAFAYDDVYAVASLSSPQLAPDGRLVAVAVRTADRERDRWIRRIDVVEVATGAPARDASGRALSAGDGDASEARWSPSGDRLAFRAHGGVRVLDVRTGVTAQLATGERTVVQFAWRPDGRAIAFAAVEKPAVKTGDARYLDAYAVGDDPALANGPPRRATLWLIDLAGGTPRALGPSADASVATGDAQSTLSFAADGSKLAYLWTPATAATGGRSTRLRIVDCSTGAERAIDTPGESVRDPLYSPDGTQLAYVSSAGDPQLQPNRVMVTAPPTGTGTVPPDAATDAASHAVDRAVHDIGWARRANALYFTADDGTQRALYRSDAGAPARRVDLGALSIGSGIDGAVARDGTIAFVGRRSGEPDELYVATPGAGPRRVTHDNDAALAGVALATTERVTYPTSLGVTGDAVLTRPPGFRPGTRYPLVVVLHGGPTSAASETFDALDQLLAARGWLVLEPNYRGSDNLGARYQAAVGGDKLRGPGDDIDAAIEAVRARGIVDTARMAVSGWSYGAGLTLWMTEVRHDWRAAVAGAAVADVAADYATADDIDADRALVGGSPLVGPVRAQAAAMSPITYAAQISTPLLLMTCRGDARVSPVGVYEMFHALRDLQRPVELIAYPVDGHVPADPVRRTDVYRRWVAYIAHHFDTPARVGATRGESGQ